MQLRPGVRVDRYTLVELLGQGGQGAVWKAVDPLDAAVRALKVIFLEGLDAGAAERARREARAVAKAVHPALVPCRALFEDPAAGIVGLVFDFVPGQSLADAALRMSPEHRRAALLQIAVALAHVHGVGLLHRDLKPANVLVTDAFWNAPHAPGGVRLIDFGIAAPAGNPHPMTAIGAVIGTIAYLSPELLAPGRWLPTPGGFTRDVFAFGVLAYELLCAAHPTQLARDAPFEAFLDIYLDAERGQRPWPPTVRESPTTSEEGPWGAAIRACLELDPQRRPASGVALAALLGVPASGPAAPRAAFASGPLTDLHLGPTELQVHVRSAPASGARSLLGDQPRTTPMPTPPSEALRPSAVTPSSGGLRPSAVTPSSGGLRPSAMTPPSGGLRRSAMTPPPPASPPTRTRTPILPAVPGARRPALLLALGGVLGAALAVAAVLLVLRWETDPGEAPMVTPPAASTAAILLPEPVIDKEPPAPVPCCMRDGKCVSKERSCRPAPCNDVVLLERSWWLRLTGVGRREEGEKEFREDLAKTHPYAQACVTRVATGTEMCIPFQQSPALRDEPPRRLQITTSEIMQGELEIRVVEAGDSLAAGRIAPNRNGLKSSVLCQGLHLYIGPRDSALVRVGVDLDER